MSLIMDFLITNSRVHCIVSLKTLYLNYLIDMTGTHLKLVQFLVQNWRISFLQNQNKHSIFVFWTTKWEFNCKTHFAIKNYFAPIWELLWEIETRDLKFLLYIIYSSASFLLSSNYHTWPGLLDQSQFAVWGHSALC